MTRPRLRLLVIGGLIATGAAAILHGRPQASRGHAVPGGVLMGNAAGYDRLSRLVLSHLFRGISADVAASSPAGGRILEIGCGPGLLAGRLATSYDLDVTGLDLDPDMIELARSNALRSAGDGRRRPTFVVGDVAALPFPDGSFDTVISTFSMHHWSDRIAGLDEIARVLAGGGRALIWDLKPGALPFHPAVDGAQDKLTGSKLTAVSVADWHWPGPLVLSQRIESVPPARSPDVGPASSTVNE